LTHEGDDDLDRRQETDEWPSAFAAEPCTAPGASLCQGGDLRVIEQMVRRLGLTWSRGNLDRFRQRARTLVREERRSIRVLADALLERRTMTDDEVGALLSAITAPRALWVVA
jgi:hypothetical protein